MTLYDFEKLRDALVKIVNLDPEKDEWEAVERYEQCQQIAREALGIPETPTTPCYSEDSPEWRMYIEASKAAKDKT